MPDLQGKTPRTPAANAGPGKVERRRTLRIKRSGLQKYELQDLDRPAIKFAENRDELQQSFALVYQVYMQKKFITQPKPHGMLYNIHSLLPDTVHIIAKSYLKVISNLSVIADTPAFGLPMDVIYRPELEALRDQGKSIVELSALATPREHRWKNIFQYLVQVMYWYCVYKAVDEVCIAINPRHVRYYKGLFPFEELGPARHYPRVDAPAIALRAPVMESMQHMLQICEALEFETPLYSYFYRMTGQAPSNDAPFLEPEALDIVARPIVSDPEDIQFFIQADQGVLEGISIKQKQALNEWYPGLGI
jgi:hypothetical protein